MGLGRASICRETDSAHHVVEHLFQLLPQRIPIHNSYDHESALFSQPDNQEEFIKTNVALLSLRVLFLARLGNIFFMMNLEKDYGNKYAFHRES